MTDAARSNLAEARLRQRSLHIVLNAIARAPGRLDGDEGVLPLLACLAGDIALRLAVVDRELGMVA